MAQGTLFFKKASFWLFLLTFLTNNKDFISKYEHKIPYEYKPPVRETSKMYLKSFL